MFSTKNHERASKTLSLKEAAVLASVNEKTIRHELEAKVIRPVSRARHHVRLDESAVLYLSLISTLPIELSKIERRALCESLANPGKVRGNWTRRAGRLVRSGTVPVEVSTVVLAREVERRLKIFERGMKRVVRSADVLGGESVFKGTRVSVSHVGLLAKRGASMAELLEDFPNLTERDIAFARMFVDLGRPPGRPRKLKLARP